MKKNINKKQVMSLLLAGFISLSGFGSFATTVSAADKSTVATTATAFPKPGTNLKIHFHYSDKYTINGANGQLLPVFQKLQEVTGYKLQNAANPAAKKSLDEFNLQAAERFPADIYGGNNTGPLMTKYGMQGAFVPLDKYFKYMPDFKKFLDAHPDVKMAITAPDGHIYYAPYVPDGGIARTYFIRTDWLKKLNLAVPKTVDELSQVLQAFKDKDPNGNGKKDEIPYFNDKWEEVVRLANLWGARVYGTDTFAVRVCLDKTSTKMYHAWTADEFRVALKNMARWYKKGLIDPEFITRKANTARQTLLIKDNTGGMTHEWVASTSTYNENADILAAVPDFKFEVILPPANGSEKGFEEHQRMAAKPDGWGISNNCKTPEAAAALMNYIFTKDGRVLANFGIEGLSYDMVDGKPIFKESVIKATGGTNNYLYGNVGAQLPIGYWQDYSYEAQWTNEVGKAGVKLYNDSKVVINNQTPILNFSKAENTTYDKINAPLNLYMDEQIQKMITGQLDVDATWPAYLKKCKDMGVDTLVTTYQSAYDNLKKKK